MLKLMLMVVAGMTSYALLLQREDDPLSCYEARQKCQVDVTCRVLLETISKVCDESINTCETTQRIHCHSVLTSLQSNVYFRNCACDPFDTENAHECLEAQRMIFLHSCVKKEGAHHPNINWPVVNPVDPPVKDVFEGTSSEEIELSCIGARKQCLNSNGCSKLLNDYRNFCRENKKLNQCLTTDWSKCYSTVQKLTEQHSDLMHCACPIKKPDIKDKCDRIRWRIRNNTCLSLIPDISSGSVKQRLTYEEIQTLANEDNTPQLDGSCIKAFGDCHRDDTCRVHFSLVVTSCAWNSSSNDCNKNACLDALRNFVTRSEKGHTVLYCSCPTEADDTCHVIQRVAFPACSTLELPPPSCSDVMNRCNQDQNCNSRWRSYEQHCSGFSVETGTCQMTSRLSTMCFKAATDLIGTVLTTRCSCFLVIDQEQRTVCDELETKLNQLDTCKVSAVRDFQNTFQAGVTSILFRDNIESLSEAAKFGSAECNRHMGNRLAMYITMPHVIRVYHNTTDCSDLCHCHENNNVTCRMLPCTPSVSCRHKEALYVHGSSTTLSDRGQCRCIRAELICAKSSFRMEPKAGLFLHVGYSVVEQRMIESHSSVIFRHDRIRGKLSTLLNELDSVEQFCGLSVHQHYEGNIIFEIILSKHHKSMKVEVCIPSAKSLSHMINSRHAIIITDPELSLLKVSQLERIHFHEHPTTKERKGDSESRASGRSALLAMRSNITDRFNCYAVLLQGVVCALFWETYVAICMR